MTYYISVFDSSLEVSLATQYFITVFDKAILTCLTKCLLFLKWILKMSLPIDSKKIHSI